MNGASREAIYGGLFSRLSALGGGNPFKLVSRRLQHWSDVDPKLFPALFQVQVNELPAANASGIPVHWELTARLYIYVMQPDAKLPSSPLLNAALDAVEGAIQPKVIGYPQDLGLPNSVKHTWIGKGAILTDEGTLGEKAVALVPVHIVAV